MAKLTIDDLQMKGKRVLVRVDFNVPLTPDLKVADDKRIVASLPTIKKVIEAGGKAILMSHLGRPDGHKMAEFSLQPCAEALSKLLDKPVAFAPDCVGPEVEKMVAAMKEGDVLLLENVRFYPEEEGKKDGQKMSKEQRQWFIDGLAKLGDLYVDDAFGTAHRNHATMAGLPAKLGKGASGYLMSKELEYFAKVFDNPQRPLLAILGGAKVSDKILVIENLLNKVDSLIIGGAMAYTFLKAQGIQVGTSRVEEDLVEKAKSYLETAKAKKVKLLLPVDHMIAAEFPAAGKTVTGTITEDAAIPQGQMGLDIGPKTIDLFCKEIANAKTIVWNGPMGVFEAAGFEKGTYAVAQAMADSQAVTVIGGGDSASAVKKAGVAKKMGHVSTGGGASLELMEGKILPGVAALSDK